MEITLTEKNRKLAVIVTLAALVVSLAIFTSLAFQFNIVQNLVMSWILTTFYAVFAFWMIDPVKIVERQVFIEKPVIREVQVPIQVPVENRTIQVVEKPVIQHVPVIKRVIEYREKPKKKLNIPKFKFQASSETRTYHKKSCRLGKLIKKKFKIQNNSQAFFKKKHFKKCKMCLKK